MEFFSEIYSCYYQVVAKILDAAAKSPLSRSQMNELSNQYAFAESSLAIVPKLCSGEWNLLEESADGYKANVQSVPPLPLTQLQGSWLKALLADRRIRLFLSDGQLMELTAFLKEYPPLFDYRVFHFFDVCKYGDPYGSKLYRKHFQLLLHALRERRLLQISYASPQRKSQHMRCLPCKFEYSQKDNMFRIFCTEIYEGKVGQVKLFNISRIQNIVPTEEFYHTPFDFERWLLGRRAPEPSKIQIFQERNALERVMLNFSNHEKRTEYDEEQDCYFSWIYYDKADETELLIKLLSFGPVIKVLEPEGLVAQIKQRVARQHALLNDPILPKAQG